TEGAEISMFYDPMVAKLCTWAPTRAKAIDAMSDALDEFVVDGIEHNIPFLSALMQHPRWREGRLSTGFIAEEYPDGFAPTEPTEEDKAVLAAVATAVELLRRDRLDRLQGRLAPHSGALKTEWVVKVNEDYLPVSVHDGMVSIPLEIDVSVNGGEVFTVSSDWRPGDAVWRGKVGTRAVSAQLRPLLNGVRIAWRGMSVSARAMLPRTAELERLMPVKLPPDTSRMLLCPMPGLVVSIAASEGQEVKAGETLAVVEAMKMENVLRAERDLVVAKLKARPGDSLAVDAVIMAFAYGLAAAASLRFWPKPALTPRFVPRDAALPARHRYRGGQGGPDGPCRMCSRSRQPCRRTSRAGRQSRSRQGPACATARPLGRAGPPCRRRRGPKRQFRAACISCHRSPAAKAPVR